MRARAPARLAAESGKATTWVLAFLAASGIGLGGLIGIGCWVGANACPFGGGEALRTTDGRILFARNCAVCHGIEGRGTANAPSLIAGELARLPVAELAARIADGKPLGGMPAFKRALGPEQIEALARHVLVLRGDETPSPAPAPAGGRT